MQLGSLRGLKSQQTENPRSEPWLIGKYESQTSGDRQSAFTTGENSANYKTQYATSGSLAMFSDCDNLFALLNQSTASEIPHLACAARTPPAHNNRFKKRLGAKKPKNM